MKAITTKYHGPSNVRGSRMSATDSDNNRVIVSYDHALNSTDNHREAARALCVKMHWHGEMIGGGTKDGMVWVWTTSDDRFTVELASKRIHPDITLSNGTIIGRKRLANGAIEAFVCGPSEIAYSREMTDSEWSEYCAIIVREREST